MFGLSAGAAAALGAVGGAAIASSMGSDTPDTSGMNDAARQNAALSKEELDWYKQIYAETKPQRDEASRIAIEQSGLQTEAARKALTQADEAAARYKATFQPLEDQIAANAQEYDTPARREAAATAASADVGAAIAGQREATMRALERSGVSPNSGRVMALQGTADILGASAKAGAANKARREIETIGAAKKMDAAGLGRGVVSSQATQAQLGLQASSAGVTSGLAPVNVANSGATMMGQGFQGAQSALTSAGNLYGQIAGINQKTEASNSAMLGGLGQAAGTVAAAYFMSDENEKEDVGPASDDEALEAVRETPNNTWRYKEDSPAADGGQMHVGPMAQNVAATMGMEAAPGGKVIDLVTMNGITNGAVRALDKKVEKIAAAVGMA